MVWGKRDYKALPADFPVWKGNANTGHGGTYNQVNGGKNAIAAVMWPEWILKANTTSGDWLMGSGAKGDGWTVESKKMDKLKVFSAEACGLLLPILSLLRSIKLEKLLKARRAIQRLLCHQGLAETDPVTWCKRVGLLMPSLTG